MAVESGCALSNHDAAKEYGFISITPKLVESGKVSPYLVRVARPGVIVRLGGVEGAFTLPDPLPAKLLFISAGSGITPIMTMLRSIDHGDGPTDAVHLHSARADRDVLFATQLRELQQRNSGFPAAPAADRRERPDVPG